MEPEKIYIHSSKYNNTQPRESTKLPKIYPYYTKDFKTTLPNGEKVEVREDILRANDGSPKEKSNIDYFNPVLGMTLRWKSSMSNLTNPIVGLNKTVIPAGEIAMIATAPWYAVNAARVSGLTTMRNAFTRAMARYATGALTASNAALLGDISRFTQQPDLENGGQLLYNFLPGSDLGKVLPNLKEIGQAGLTFMDLRDDIKKKTPGQ